MLKKRSTALICAITLAGGAIVCTPAAELPTVSAAGTVTKAEGTSSSNTIDISSHYYDNQDKTVKSYLYESGKNTLTRVEYTGSALIAEDIDMTTGKLIKSRTLDMPLSLFGGFYSGKDYNFVVTGESNSAESNDNKILAVTRYSKDFKSSKNVYLYGRNTYIPFDAGSCRMTEAGGKLYIHTCHEMYQSSDGYHHQANMSYVLNEETMKFEQEHYQVSWPDYTGKIGDAFGYSSHSFDQFITSDDTAVYAYDHGDAYPRALRLHKYTLSDGYLSYSDLVTIPGSTGANYTSVTTGDMELSKNNVLIGVKMADMSGGSLDSYSALKNIFVIVMPKSSIGTSAKPTLVNLTNYSSGTKIKQNSAPRMVKINDNKFIVMWKECESISTDYDWDKGEWVTTENGAVTRIAVIDGSGKLVGSVMQNKDIALSDCDPVLCSDGKVRWYTAFGSSPILYTLDPNDPSNFGSKRVAGDADNNGKVSIADVIRIQQYLAGWKVKLDASSSDVTGDGKVTIADVIRIQQHLAGWKVTLK